MGEFVMHRLFPIVCNMSLTASVVILAVLAVRRLLRRAPKVFSYALWAVVLFRLLCPVSVTSAVSLLGALGAPAQERSAVTSVVEYVPADIVRNMAPTVTPLPQEPFPAEPGKNIVSTAPSVTQPAAAPASPLSGPVAVLTLTWLTGMALLLLYSVISLLRLRRRLVGAVRLEDNIYLADYIEPNRDFPGVDELRRAVYDDLDKGLLMGLSDTIDEMERMGNPVHHDTLEARDFLLRGEAK